MTAFSINPAATLWPLSVISGLVSITDPLKASTSSLFITPTYQAVNYGIYDKSEGKTKNDYFREMLIEVLAWGLKPAFVTGDSWYS